MIGRVEFRLFTVSTAVNAFMQLALFDRYEFYYQTTSTLTFIVCAVISIWTGIRFSSVHDLSIALWALHFLS